MKNERVKSRMSCVSTWLVDREDDHGVKADELMTLLEGALAEPGAKAVVFSQWIRTHEIVGRRLTARGIGHVSFHGDVAADRRPALLQRFRDDPECHVFLSTDAGASGLNLQHASLLVNMDLPWNPAVLEQRAGRVHRLGQRRPVRIVSFVAKGTIEEGMLGVLAFKRSLSAGILDGGLNEVALGGSRLTRFIKEVESVTGTGAVAEAEPVTAAEEKGETEVAPEVAAPEVEVEAPTSPAASAADPWAALVEVGSELLTALTGGTAGTGSAARIERDPATGAVSLRFPLPPPETTRRLADALGTLAQLLRSGG